LNNTVLYPLNRDHFLPGIPAESLVIDALFGSGLSRPLEGAFTEWAKSINTLQNIVVSIDIPSGLFADLPTPGIAVEADFTLSFQVPKRAFLIPENQHFVGEWIVLPIGLIPEYQADIASTWNVLTEQEVAVRVKTRRKFDHKGMFGHALLIAGSYGKAGAAVLASRAALHTGAGLVTTHVPGLLNPIMQTSIPEVMVETDSHQQFFTQEIEPAPYSAIGVGCGIGVHPDTAEALRSLLHHTRHPLVIDADAINIIAQNKDLLNSLPPHTILTPHFKEFERLFGESTDHFDRLDKLQSAAVTHHITIVLKGAHTAIATPEGMLYFNTTGNPGMATAGSGDVLTGMITGLLAQGYRPVDAAILGVYLHGLAGDLAAEKEGYEAMIASDIIAQLGSAFSYLHEIDRTN
jgi:NAD(P)H-hydrate epimerase